MVNDSKESAQWSMGKMAILWSNFVVIYKVNHFDHENSYFGHGLEMGIFVVKFRGKIIDSPF